jgi:hypothetical protein
MSTMCLHPYTHNQSQHEIKAARLERPKGEELVPDANEREPHETHPHRSAKGTVKQATVDNRKTTSAKGRERPCNGGLARHPSEGVQARAAQGRVAVAQGDAELPERPRDEGVPREAWAPSLYLRRVSFL